PDEAAFLDRNPVTPGRQSAAARVALERRIVHIEDVQNDPDYSYGVVQVEPLRTVLAIPMLRANELLGVITVNRHEVRLFTDSQIALMETFADQAAIAIENARLLTELQERNADLTEALEQQTATSEILRVISSSPTDVQPVFDAIVRNGVTLCDAAFGIAARFDGQIMSMAAFHNLTPEEVQTAQGYFPSVPTRGGATGRALVDRRVVHIHDVRDDPDYTFTPAVQETLGYRTALAVPMLREGNPIGALSMWRRQVKPFTQKQIELMTTFADQAVIAVENVRLFTELE